MAFFSRLLINIFCITALLCSLKAMATDDEYLKMLEGEAEDLELDKSGQLKDREQTDKSTTDAITKKDWKWEGELQGDILPPGLAQDEFATILQQNYYGSFAFFSKLNSIDQQTVYYHYTKASPAHLEAIRQDILDHLKK